MLLPLLALFGHFKPAIQPESPGVASGHGFVYAEALGGSLLTGGDSADGKSWLWNGTAWSVASVDSPKRSLPAITYDSDRKIVVMFGGANPIPSANGFDWKPTSDTWSFDGKGWKKLSSSGPEPRDHCAMVYDSTRKRIVLFGGSDADPSGRSKFFGDTWEWDGAAWKLMASGGPIPRCHHDMAYDPIRKVTVLVGGFGAGGTTDSKTWEWSGSKWSAIEAHGPATRTSPRLAFHSELGKVVLFGGETGEKLPSDTWSWNGKTWDRIAETGPPGRTVHGLAYDSKRAILVLYGGATPDSIGDLWEFKDAAWRKR